MPPTELIVLLVLGFAAGILGGLLGIGGSVIMIPVLVLLLGRNQHLAQAAAMIVNVFVAAPAVWRHQKAGAVPWGIVWKIIPAGLVFIVIGVEVSNMLNPEIIARIFGVFLIYVIFMNVRKLFSGTANTEVAVESCSWPRAITIGAITGFAAGLLGIGGGIIAVPLLQRLGRLPLRRCIATSASMMCITATVGAARKNVALADLGLDAGDSVLIAACLAPTAVIGGLIGGSLTHVLPLKWLRLVLVILMALASLRFLGVV